MNSFLNYAVIPCIFASFTKIKKGVLSLNLVLYFLILIFQNVKH